VPIEEPVAALRLVYYLGGLACFSTMWILHDLNIWLNRHANGLAVFTCLIAGLSCFFLACRTTVPRWLCWLLPYSRMLVVVGLVGALWACSYSLDKIAHFPTALARPRHYWNDAIAMTDCSTRLVLHGQNPYTDFSLADCFARLHLTGKFSTPLRAGVFAHVRIYPTDQAQIRVLEMARRHHVQHPVEFESYLSYPAGAFLVPAPFYALGWHEMSTFYIAWIVLAYLLLAWLAPWRLRPWLAPLALANLAYWDYAIHGFSEGLVVFLILAGWVTWRRAWLSAVLMGVAIATRQDAWLFAVFYAILIGRTSGWRDAARRLAVMVALFGLANGPFILWSPTAWIAGVFGPLRDPMFPRGEGFIALGTTGWLPLWPRSVYTAVEIAVLGACLLLYGGICRRHPDTGLVLALVPLVFAWRALFVYFFLPLPILCLAPLLMGLRAHPSHRLVSGMGRAKRTEGR
jgi:hypothetical protein